MHTFGSLIIGDYYSCLGEISEENCNDGGEVPSLSDVIHVRNFQLLATAGPSGAQGREIGLK